MKSGCKDLVDIEIINFSMLTSLTIEYSLTMSEELVMNPFNWKLYSVPLRMCELLSFTENAVWHAFDFLALESGGSATKSKLKVITRH